jgi:predicted RNase H-like HicB family nuclease/uncharacterized damage-inducible protein DinB
MRVRLAVEDLEPNHWIAWAFDLPGCFSSAATAAEAVAYAPQRITEYFSWLSNQDSSLPIVNETIEVEIVETFHSFASREDPEYVVNAFFEDDRRPLGYLDVEVASRLLDWTRQDLQGVIRLSTQDQIVKNISGEVHGSIAGILNHIAVAENWYCDQLGFGLQREQLPGDPLERIKVVRANTREQLTKLISDERVTENNGELWSARKVVRRTLWHERDHTQHIAHLLPGL